MVNKIRKFLDSNGWGLVDDDEEYRSFGKEGNICIEIAHDKSEIVLLDDSGDFAHLPFNVYALIGFMYAKRLFHPEIPNGI